MVRYWKVHSGIRCLYLFIYLFIYLRPSFAQCRIYPTSILSVYFFLYELLVVVAVDGSESDYIYYLLLVILNLLWHLTLAGGTE